MKKDFKDASNAKIGDKRLIKGKWRVAVAVPMHIGNDEYKTVLRWWLVPGKEARKLTKLKGV